MILPPGRLEKLSSDGCAWNVINTNGWISLLSGSNGVGNGTVSYGVSPNPATSARVGYFLIADQSFAVTQQGAACSYAFSPGSATVEHGASTNFISVTTSPDCAWTAVNHTVFGQKITEWIDILSEGANNTGSGTVVYVVRDLPATYWRTGFFLIAGRIFEVTQRGIPCNYGIAATNRTYGAGATNDTVQVTAADICSWSIGSADDWITILSGPGGSGPATVSYALTANPGPDPRIGGIFFAGQF